MTFEELAIAILNLPHEERHKPAGVWPPGACPEASFVPVTGLERTGQKELTYVISTGKKPA